MSSYYYDTPSPASSSSSIAFSTGGVKHNKYKQREVLVRRKFAECIQEYIQIDTQLQQVMDSISHLRTRMISSSRWIQQQQEQKWKNRHRPPHTKDDDDDNNNNNNDWQTFGFRGHCRSTIGSHSLSTGFLHVKDVELALSHELLQHERMLSLTRTLLSNQSTTLDTMSRRLEEWMTWELDLATVIATTSANESQSKSGGMKDNELSSSSNSHILPLIYSDAQQAFLYLGQDLYRKQGLFQQVLDTSSQDDLLVLSQKHDNNNGVDGLMILDNIQPRRRRHHHHRPRGEGGQEWVPTKVARSNAQEWNLWHKTRKEEWEIIDRFSSLV